MKESKDKKDYFFRLIEVVNEKLVYGEDVVNQRIIQNFLISLSKKYDFIATINE